MSAWLVILVLITCGYLIILGWRLDRNPATPDRSIDSARAAPQEPEV